ncbi:MAG: DMT family transporter [candidate division WOR-3 bacterium]
MDEGLILAFLTTILWSTVATAFKLTLRYIDFRSMLFYSSLTSFLILSLINLFKNKKIFIIKSKKEILNSLFLGFLNPYLYYLILFKAYSLLKAQIAQPLNYTWPIVLSIFSALILKSKIKKINILSLLISFTGVFIISTEGNIFKIKVKEPLGVSLAISSSFIFALYWILNLKDKRNEAEKLSLNFFFGFIYILITQSLTGSLKIINFKGLLGSIYIGLFEMGITFLIWLKALKKSKNIALTSNIIYLSPFLSLFFINLILREKILISTFFGLILIVSGIILNRLAT